MSSQGKTWHAASFRIEIDGIPAGVFKNVEGLDSQTDVVESKAPGPVKYGDITLKKGYIENADPFGHKVQPGAFGHKVNPVMHKVNPAAHKINPVAHKVNPGAAMPAQGGGRLVLHGFELDQRNKQLLRHWVDATAPQKATPRGQIVMLDLSGRPVRRWQFFEAWPSKWHVPDLTSSSSSSSSSGSSVELVVGRLVKM